MIRKLRLFDDDEPAVSAPPRAATFADRIMPPKLIPTAYEAMVLRQADVEADWRMCERIMDATWRNNQFMLTYDLVHRGDVFVRVPFGPGAYEVNRRLVTSERPRYIATQMIRLFHEKKNDVSKFIQPRIEYRDFPETA